MQEHDPYGDPIPRTWQHCVLEDMAQAVLCLDQGQALWIYQGIRERGQNLLRQVIPYTTVQSNSSSALDTIQILSSSSSSLNVTPTAKEKEEKGGGGQEEGGGTTTTTTTKTSHGTSTTTTTTTTSHGNKTNNEEDTWVNQNWTNVQRQEQQQDPMLPPTQVNRGRTKMALTISEQSRQSPPQSQQEQEHLSQTFTTTKKNTNETKTTILSQQRVAVPSSPPQIYMEDNCGT